MPTTRKQTKAIKSREVDMCNVGCNNLERDESETSNYGRRPESSSYGTLLN